MPPSPPPPPPHSDLLLRVRLLINFGIHVKQVVSHLFSNISLYYRPRCRECRFVYPRVVSHVLVSYLMYSSPDSLMQYGCVMASHVSWPSCCLRHVQYPVAVITCVLSDNCLLDGAFSMTTYTPRWCHTSLGQVVVYGMYSTRWLLSHVLCQIIVY